MKQVYLAGQSNEHAENSKEKFKSLGGFKFIDPEVDSDQSSPRTFFPDDLRHIDNSDILVANSGIAPSEAMWTEVGYFYARKTKPGEICNNLIIIWKDERNPKWSKPFIDMMGHVVLSVDEAMTILKQLA